MIDPIAYLHLDFSLTSSHRIPFKHNFFFGTAIGERLNTHSDFCVFWPGALSTRHPWRAIVRADVYTRNCFLESVGSQFGGPGQKALPAMNEFTLLWIPLFKTCSFDYQPRICKDGFISMAFDRSPVCRLSTGCWSIIGCCVGACQLSSCAEERRPQ